MCTIGIACLTSNNPFIQEEVYHTVEMLSIIYSADIIAVTQSR